MSKKNLNVLPNLHSVILQLKWREDDLERDLGNLRNSAVEWAKDAEEWYFSAKASKKFWGILFRISMISLTAGAALLPLVNEIYRESESGSGREIMNPLWSAVLLGVASAVLALDRFYGMTSGWVRYVLTGQKLTALIGDFLFKYEQLRIAWKNQKPNYDQALKAAILINEFSKNVNETVIQETEIWAKEFAAIIEKPNTDILK